jgi:glutamine phosphoribosylpyrophosphate amidotransferase
MRTTQNNQILLSLVGNVGSRIRMIDDSTVAGTILQRYIKLLRSINLQTNIL